ncbi:hypothetical protein ACFQ5F_09990 [Kroppenstedtia eburnea]|uniref:hypothetical protein n=1 Tax=Kroppenstedtia eburnea TaxID=714067 RepID=UPI00363490FA
MRITKWEALMTAETAMIRAGIDPAKQTEVLAHMQRITEKIDYGTKERVKERQENGQGE